MELSDPARKELAAISSSLLSWFYENHRDLPWRSDRTPYSTWISEAMLQQTRVTTVLDYYPRFLNRFPDPSSLAKASEDEVLKLWEGLGYYSRARNLKRGAEYICEHFGGILPSDPDLLLKIPGIGPYMQGAIASLAYDIAIPAVDGNCIRIYCRLHTLPLVASEQSTYKEIYKRVKEDLPDENPGDFNEALMDLGSLICTPRSPKCEACPLRENCSAFLLGKQEDFPAKKEKKETPTEDHTILKIYVGDKIIVKKRPARGLLAGLYELVDIPGIKTSSEVEAFLSEYFSLESLPKSEDLLDIRPIGKSRHVFSHLKWNMLGYEIHLPASFEKEAAGLGEAVSPRKYESLAFASAIRAYR